MGRITRTKYGLCSTTVFNNAECLQLPVNSPIELVPFVPGKVWRLSSVALLFSWAANLTGVDDDTEVILVSWDNNSGQSLQVGKNGLFTGGESQVCGSLIGTIAFGSTTPSPIATNIAGNLVLVVGNGGANPFTGGALGNQLTVKVFLESFDVPIIA